MSIPLDRVEPINHCGVIPRSCHAIDLDDRQLGVDPGEGVGDAIICT